MIVDIQKTIRDYLTSVYHLSLATCKNNKPRVCEVHFVYDNQLNLYFRSRPSRRHSTEIKLNPHVSWNIVESHEIDAKVRWVYFEWSAKLLTIEESIDVFHLFEERLHKDRSKIEEAKEEDWHKIYKITVAERSLFDARESNPSQKYSLPRQQHSWEKMI